MLLYSRLSNPTLGEPIPMSPLQPGWSLPGGVPTSSIRQADGLSLFHLRRRHRARA